MGRCPVAKRYQRADKCVQVHVDVAADPARVLQPTQSQLAEAAQRAAVFAPLHGYSAAAITSDRRWRAGERLHAHGLAHLPAARDALAALHARAMPRRPDCLTTDQRAARALPQ
jgi:hypothetical protein